MSCDDPPAWSPVWRTVPARFQRAGASENVAEPDRPSESEELPPDKTLRVRGASSTNQNNPSVGLYVELQMNRRHSELLRFFMSFFVVINFTKLSLSSLVHNYERSITQLLYLNHNRRQKAKLHLSVSCTFSQTFKGSSDWHCWNLWFATWPRPYLGKTNAAHHKLYCKLYSTKQNQ